MVGVVGIVIIISMAARACIGGIVVITVVTGSALVGNHRVGAI